MAPNDAAGLNRRAQGDRQMTRGGPRALRGTAFVVALALLLAGCAGGEVPRSDFLGDLSRLQRVPDTEAYAAWRKPGAGLAPYTRVILDPVEMRYAGDPTVRTAGAAEIERMKTYFRQSTMLSIDGAFPVVETPGPNVMRVRVAITGLSAARAGTDAAAPDRLDFSLFIGQAAIESEVRDSLTGERLAAIVDRQELRRAAQFRNVIASWSEAEATLEAWARIVRARLEGLRR
jgi:hypothetical protein